MTKTITHEQGDIFHMETESGVSLGLCIPYFTNPYRQFFTKTDNEEKYIKIHNVCIGVSNEEISEEDRDDPPLEFFFGNYCKTETESGVKIYTLIPLVQEQVPPQTKIVFDKEGSIDEKALEEHENYVAQWYASRIVNFQHPELSHPELSHLALVLGTKDVTKDALDKQEVLVKITEHKLQGTDSTQKHEVLVEANKTACEVENA